MRVTMASVAARPGRVTEDFTAAGPGAAVLIDGAGIPGGEAVCRHGVAWYATRLGGTLLGLLSLGADRGLREVLAEAIERVTGEHQDTCAVADPISPSAAVAVLRRSGDEVDYLVLGDATLVLDSLTVTDRQSLVATDRQSLVVTDRRSLVVTDRRSLVVTDRREVAFSRAAQAELDAGADRQRVLRDLRAHRNRAGGFWVAKDDPRAAAEAVTGSCPAREAVLLSNGASRFVDFFALTDWAGLMTVTASAGPAEVIRQVRQAEAHAGIAADDATVTYCTGLGER